MSALASASMPVRFEEERERPKLLSFARACSCDYGAHHHASGLHNGTPEDFFKPWHWWAHDYRTQRNPETWEGCVWIDKRPALETAAGVSMVIRGPMCNVDLGADEVERCPDPDPLFAAGLSQASGEFGVLLAMHLTKAPEEIGALDYVSLPVFAAMWKRVGARVGVIRSGQFVELEGGHIS